MKAVLPSKYSMKGGRPLTAKPPIPLFPSELEQAGMDNYLKVKIKFQPGEKGSQDCTIAVHLFEQGTPIDWIRMNHELERIFDGQKLQKKC